MKRNNQITRILGLTLVLTACLCGSNQQVRATDSHLFVFHTYEIRTEETLSLYLEDRDDAVTSDQIAPQIVTVLGESNGFFKLHTWSGDRWIKQPSTYYELMDDDYQLRVQVPIYDQVTKQLLGNIAPQKVHVLQKSMPNPLHSYQIDTWLGKQWVFPGRFNMDLIVQPVKEECTINVVHTTPLYEYPEQQLNTYPTLDGPELIKPLKSFERWRNWYHVHTNNGDLWINQPEAFIGDIQVIDKKINLTANKVLYLYPEHYPYKEQIGPQTVHAIAQISGWYQIETWVGNMWIDKSDLIYGSST